LLGLGVGVSVLSGHVALEGRRIRGVDVWTDALSGGVEVEVCGPGSTESSTAEPPEPLIGTAGNARPNSSAVRAAPITTARSARDPHDEHRNAASVFPHHRQLGLCATSPDALRDNATPTSRADA
ncbi:hypothetical protein, partial [Nocardia sp. ncl2]|uniref:hypothetical protein n=1 Tax=Nocardia alni TaxID=2815723 RepID=UPI001C223975